MIYILCLDLFGIRTEIEAGLVYHLGLILQVVLVLVICIFGWLVEYWMGGHWDMSEGGYLLSVGKGQFHLFFWWVLVEFLSSSFWVDIVGLRMLLLMGMANLFYFNSVLLSISIPPIRKLTFRLSVPNRFFLLLSDEMIDNPLLPIIMLQQIGLRLLPVSVAVWGIYFLHLFMTNLRGFHLSMPLLSSFLCYLIHPNAIFNATPPLINNRTLFSPRFWSGPRWGRLQVDVVFVVVGDGYASLLPAFFVPIFLSRMMFLFYILRFYLFPGRMLGQVELCGVCGVEIGQIVPPPLALYGRTNIDDNTILNTLPSNPLYKTTKMLSFNNPGHNLRKNSNIVGILYFRLLYEWAATHQR